MRQVPIDTEELEIQGLTVQVEYYYDNDMEPPWEDDCGCGPVRKTVLRHNDWESDKKPGERPLNQPDRNEYQFYYDWKAAMEMAKKDGWNTEPYDAPNKALRAVEANFKFLKAFLDEDWHYVGIVVKLGEEEDSCWGFETWKDYHKEAAKEMAEGLVESHLKEQAEAQYWMERT